MGEKLYGWKSLSQLFLSVPTTNNLELPQYESTVQSMTDSSSKTQIKTDKIHVLAGILREFRVVGEERIWVKKPRYNEVRVITRRVITRYDCNFNLSQAIFSPNVFVYS